MGRDKALLPLGRETFLEHLIAILQDEVRPLVVVLGHHAEEIAGRLPRSAEVRIVRNPDYKLGQLSSLKAALRSLQDPPGQPIDGALVCLVDHPAITTPVVRALLERFRSRQSRIIIPTFRGRRGHPVFFAAELFPELLAAPLEEGARFVVRRHAADVDLIETEEEGILLDIDRPSDYELLRERWK